MDIEKLVNSTIFIYNKHYEHAKLAQWGTGSRDVGTYEQRIYPDQLWLIEASTKYPGYYYISNAKHEGYRLAKWGKGDSQVGVYSGQYYDDQLWKFQQYGEYYRIYNKEYPTHKIAKWGKKDGDWGTYSGPDYEDQLWRLVPRFQVKAREHEIWFCDNRQGSRDIPKEFKVTTGLKLTQTNSLTTRVGFEHSLKSSVSAGVEGLGSASLESQVTLSSQIESSISSAEERTWSKETTTTFTAPAGKKYQVVQTLLDFSSPLNSDNCSLYCKEIIKESD